MSDTENLDIDHDNGSKEEETSFLTPSVQVRSSPLLKSTVHICILVASTLPKIHQYNCGIKIIISMHFPKPHS